MSVHIYTRAIVDNIYNIDNKARVDGVPSQIYIAKEIEAALPGLAFKMCCNATEAKFTFDDNLTGGQITTLENIVTAHKNNT